MKMALEDLQRIREISAENGTEMTPDQILALLNEARPVTVVNEPGLVTELRKDK